jgi:hypothetical protein
MWRLEEEADRVAPGRGAGHASIEDRNQKKGFILSMM